MVDMTDAWPCTVQRGRFAEYREKQHSDRQEERLTTTLGALLLLFPCLLRLSNQVLAFVDRVRLDIGVMSLL